MFYDSYHIIGILAIQKGLERIYTVVGNICETDTGLRGTENYTK